MIWILILSFKRNMLGIIISIFNQTSWTAIVSITHWTVDQLLFRKKDHLIVLDSVSTLNWASCWKWPTGTASSLILYWTYFTLIYPVYRSWKICKRVIKYLNIILFFFQIRLKTKHLLILAVLPISKFIEFNHVRTWLRHLFLNLNLFHFEISHFQSILIEYFKSHFEFILIFIILVIRRSPLKKMRQSNWSGKIFIRICFLFFKKFDPFIEKFDLVSLG